MKTSILVKYTNMFFDPHGFPDEGHFYYNVVLLDDFLRDYPKAKENKTYTWNEEKSKLVKLDNADYSSEDGYNCQIEFFTYKIITQEEALKYEKIIEEYNNLELLFNE